MAVIQVWLLLCVPLLTTALLVDRKFFLSIMISKIPVPLAASKVLTNENTFINKEMHVLVINDFQRRLNFRFVTPGTAQKHVLKAFYYD